MSELHEQRVNITFCFKLGKTFTETHEMLEQAYGDQCVGLTQCYEWFQRFKDGRQSTDDDPRPGRPSTSTDAVHFAHVHAVICSNRRLTVREIAEECKIFVGSRYAILTEKLEMHPVAAKFVPRLLTEDQRERRVAFCQELLDRANEDENFMNCVITSNDTWVYGYDVETNAQF
jgi:histone-lysine N-methyltransferase SETMAR